MQRISTVEETPVLFSKLIYSTHSLQTKCAYAEGA